MEVTAIVVGWWWLGWSVVLVVTGSAGVRGWKRTLSRRASVQLVGVVPLNLPNSRSVVSSHCGVRAGENEAHGWMRNMSGLILTWHRLLCAVQVRGMQ